MIKEEKKYEFERSKAIQLLRGISANMSNLSESSIELANQYNIIEMIILDAVRQIEEIEK